jgi:hypothetical protein
MLLAIVPVAFPACDDSAIEPGDARMFVIEVSGEQFKVRVTDPQDAAALQQRLNAGQTGVISGKLVAGHGGFNTPWSWHLDPATIEVPDMAIELCDGRPSFVEADLPYWLNSVRNFCPWGARVVGSAE